MRHPPRLALVVALSLAAGACARAASPTGRLPSGRGSDRGVAAEPAPMDSAITLELIPAFPGRGQYSTTTVIVVRHAEKATGQGDDPHLSDSGERRAEALARSLENAGVSAVITTQWRRTSETALPTVRESGATTEVVPVVWDSIPRHAAAVAAAVRRHPGEVVLVVGHSNTVPDIVAALGIEKPAELCDSEYDRMEIVSMEPGGNAQSIESRYGSPTVERTGCASMR